MSVSDVQNLDPNDNDVPTNDGVPSAEAAGHVAQGEPRDYSDTHVGEERPMDALADDVRDEDGPRPAV